MNEYLDVELCIGGSLFLTPQSELLEVKRFFGEPIGCMLRILESLKYREIRIVNPMRYDSVIWVEIL